MLPLFYNLRNTLVSMFTGWNLVLQLIAFLVTYLIVTSGFDWKYFTLIQNWPLGTYVSPAVRIGGMIPMFGIPLLYIIAKIIGNKIWLLRTWALTQAAMLGWCISSLYKSFTGRVQPPRGILADLIDSSHDWNFGFYEHGIFWGWPSSHTTVAFAMAFAVVGLFPKNKPVVILSLLYALYIGIGITVRIHWFSEFQAGAILGAIIGLAVGNSFYKKIRSL